MANKSNNGHVSSGDTILILKLKSDSVNKKFILLLRDFIHEDMTLYDIKLFVRNFILNYIKTYNTYMIRIYTRYLFIRSIMDAFTNMVNIIVIWKFSITYLDALYLVLNPTNSRMISLIISFTKAFNYTFF